MNQRVLLIDDEVAVLDPLTQVISDMGIETFSTTDPVQGVELARSHSPAVVLTDLRMPGLDGMEVLRRVKELAPGVQVVMISGHANVDEAVAAMKKGAYDFITKPFTISEIENVVLRALEKAALVAENDRLRDAVRRSRMPSFSQGRNPEFLEVLENAAKAAGSDATMLILGESGTGKEVLARYVVASSPRADKPFVTVNCAAIPENLIESELFGHRKGAFTGAHQDRAGRFQEAHGGTLFLDEIGELPLSMQAKLLRVLQEGEVSPVGGIPARVNVRIIAATNKDLRRMINEGHFREDLFYRLNVIPLSIPPLRHRGDDLHGYIAFFLAKYSGKNGKEGLSFTDEALRLMERYPWPGNLRELENAIERAVILTTGREITSKSLTPEVRGETETAAQFSFRRGMTLEEIELLAIGAVLRYNNGDRARSAAELGISERTLYRRLNEMSARGLDADDPAAGLT